MRSVTPKQQRFIEELLIDDNASAAALRAGYSRPASGRNLIAKPHVLAAINRERRKRSKRTEITADMVLQRLWQIANAAPDDATVWGTRTTQAGTHVPFQASAQVKALELCGQHLGMFRGGADDELEDEDAPPVRLSINLCGSS